MAVSKLKTFVVLGAAAATISVGIMPANAANTWTVSAGAAANGTVVNIGGKTLGASPQITFKDVTTNTVLTCTSGTAKGKTTVGSGRAGRGIGSITGSTTTWVGCTGPLSIALHPTGHGVWSINAVSFAAGVTTGTITNANATVTGTGCSFTVKGSVPITYTNSTHVLSVKNTASNLVVSNVSGCFGAVNNADHASFQADYKLTGKPAANNPITITKP